MYNLGGMIEEQLYQWSAASVTNGIVFALIVVFIVALIILIATRSGVLLRLLGFIHYTPNLLTSIGILGTFVGIVIGLLDFDVSDIDGSIGSLLEGLKTAFITSLAGMSLAILFKILDSSGLFRRKQEERSAEHVGPGEIYVELRAQREALERLGRVISGDEDSTLISQIRLLRSDGQEQSRHAIEQLRKQTEWQEQIYSTLAFQHQQFEAFSADLWKKLDAFAEMLSKQTEYQGNIYSGLLSQYHQFKEFSTDLWEKLDAFAEMLSKSATEQVINALKEVIADFNRNLTEQFGENFKALNAAVEKLVQWQENYREQISQMIDQYAQGVQAITQTEAAVAHISEESKQIPVTMGELKTVLETTQHQLAELDQHLAAFCDMRDRAVEAVPQIRAQMDTMVNEVSSAVKGAGEHIVTASQAASQAIVEGAKEFEDRVHRTNEDLTSASDQLANNSERIREQLEDTVKEINDQVRNMAIGVAENTKKVSDTLVNANKELGSSIKEVQFQVTDSIERMQKRLEKSAQDTNKHVRDTMAGAAENVKEITITLGSAHKDLQTSLKESQFQVTDSIETMQKRLEGALEEIFQAQTRAIARSFEAVEDELRKSVSTTGEAVNKQLEAIDKAMQQEVERVMNEMGKALAMISSQFTSDYSQLTDHMAQVVSQARSFNGRQKLSN
jgi:chromosome segregation ATPase